MYFSNHLFCLLVCGMAMRYITKVLFFIRPMPAFADLSRIISSGKGRRTQRCWMLAFFDDHNISSV